MKPINGWILVEKIEEEEKKSAGGIILPKEAAKQSEKIQKSKILQISEDVYRAWRKDQMDPQYKVGDIVYTHSQVGIELVPFDKDNKVMYMKFDAVMGIEEC